MGGDLEGIPSEKRKKAVCSLREDARTTPARVLNAVAVPSPCSHAHKSFPMPEAPIVTTGVIREVLSGRTFRVEVPNGKLVIGHLPSRLVGLAGQLVSGISVDLEMTPFDFEKARIVGRANNSDG